VLVIRRQIRAPGLLATAAAILFDMNGLQAK
jgi:hypothetical protein